MVHWRSFGRTRLASSPIRRVVVSVMVAGGLGLAATACLPGPHNLALDVNTTKDGHDAHPGDGICEMKAGQGNCSLRAAVEEANASAVKVPVITVPPGRYVLTLGELANHPAAGLTIIQAAAPGALIDANGAPVGLGVTGGATLVFGVAVTGATGGGYAAQSGATLDVTSGSSHDNGAGLIVAAGATAGTNHVTLSDNQGAGIVNDGNLRATFTTVTANSGGGVLGSSPVSLEASIVADQAGGPDCATPAASTGFNLDSDSSCGLSANGDVSAQPAELKPLTHTALAAHPPRKGSPAINAIPTGVGLCQPASTLVDQAGHAMPIGSGCDRGAIEADFTPLSLTVNSAADASDAHPGDGRCATTVGTCTLRAAVDEANAYPSSGDTASIAAGVNPTLTIPGPVEDANATGDLDVVDGLTLHGNGATLDANQLDRAFDDLAGPLAIDDLTITGGLSDSASPIDTGGSQRNQGGAISSAGELTLTSVTLTGNQARGFDRGTAPGGAIFATGPLTIVDSSIYGNESDNRGAAIEADGPTTVIRDTTVTANNAQLALGSDTLAPAGTAAIYAAGGSLTISGSTIADNSGTAEGAVGEPAVSGGLWVAAGTAVVTNTTLSGNTVSDPDFPALIDEAVAGDGSTTLIDDTIAGTPGADSSRLLRGVLTMQGSIVSSPSGPACVFIEDVTSVTVHSLGHNAVSDASCALTGPGDLQSTDAQLGPLAHNGGPTATRSPGLGSPVIDAVPIGTTELCDRTIPTDQRGVARPQGAACDIGAVEVVAPP